MKHAQKFSICAFIVLLSISIKPQPSSADADDVIEGLNTFTNTAQALGNSLQQYRFISTNPRSNRVYQLQSQINQSIRNMQKKLNDGLLACFEIQQNTMEEFIEDEESEEFESVFGEDEKLSNDKQYIKCKEPDDSFQDKANGTVTCENAIEQQEALDEILTSQRCKRDHIRNTKNALSCITNINQTLKDASEKLKDLVIEQKNSQKQLMEEYDSAIKEQTETAENLDKEINDKDNGHKARLADLENLYENLDKALTTFGGAADRPVIDGDEDKITLYGALQDRLAHLETTEVTNVAQTWHNSISSRIQGCIKGAPNDCTKNSTIAIGAVECLRSQIRVSEKSPGDTARNENNFSVLKKIFDSTDSFLNKEYSGSISNSDARNAKNVAQSIKATVIQWGNIFDDRFFDYKKEFRGGNRAKFSDIRKNFHRHLSSCRDSALKAFESDLNSNNTSTTPRLKKPPTDPRQVSNDPDDYIQVSANPIRASLENLRRKRWNLNSDIQSWNSVLTRQMQNFQTQFTKREDNSLFKKNEECRRVSAKERNNPRKSLDCLLKFRKILKDGIQGGTGRSITNIKTPYISKASPSGLNVQYRNQSCDSFRKCVNLMEKARDAHSTLSKTLEKNKKSDEAVYKNIINGSISQIDGAIKAVFNDTSGSKPYIDGLNRMLGEVGISSINFGSMKDIKATLMIAANYDDEKILESIPASGDNIEEIKDALDEELDGKDGIKRKIRNYSKLLSTANEAVTKCSIDPEEYEKTFKNFSCGKNYDTPSEESLCNKNNIENALRELERLAKKASSEVQLNGGRYWRQSRQEKRKGSVLSECKEKLEKENDDNENEKIDITAEIEEMENTLNASTEETKNTDKASIKAKLERLKKKLERIDNDLNQEQQETGCWNKVMNVIYDGQAEARESDKEKLKISTKILEDIITGCKDKKELNLEKACDGIGKLKTEEKKKTKNKSSGSGTFGAPSS